MEYVRVNGMIDINDAILKGLVKYDEPEYHGTRKNKFWFNDYTWMYKDVDNEFDTYEEYAEVLSYEIAKLVGISCAEYDLATFNGNKGVITKSVVPKGEKIISGTELLTTVYNEYMVNIINQFNCFKDLLEKYNINSYEECELLDYERKKSFKSGVLDIYKRICFLNNCSYVRVSNFRGIFDYIYYLNEAYSSKFVEYKNGIIMSNNLYDIWDAVELYCRISGYTVDTKSFMDDLINMLIFDIITGQGDRHADNWSIIIDKNGHVRLAGLYDNSGALSLNREKALNNIKDFSDRLKCEKNPGKINGIIRQLNNTINHAFSGLKITKENIENRSKNNEIISTFISHSSEEFIDKLRNFIGILSDENIIKIFNNIEEKTGYPVPDKVKVSTLEVINYNRSLIKNMVMTEGDGENVRTM